MHPKLLVFLFGMAAWVCWMKWMMDGIDQ